MKNHIYPTLFILATALIACKKDTAQEEDSVVTLDSTPYQLQIPTHFPAPELPQDNPLPIQGVRLGKLLFHETMLSGDNSQSCASCHSNEFAFTDSAQFSIGIQGLPGGRNAMSVFNMAWNNNGFFWDGRAAELRDQALLPIQDELE
ncbi:MAG: cytochrome-c peroxidase, partial [Flavobacteriales bacterium]|nr:cytochrome-c peroxidase [Flavobacteriales bacterium]